MREMAERGETDFSFIKYFWWKMFHPFPFFSFAVTGSTDDGMLEGLLRGRAGLFPANCVQEVKLRNPDAIRQQQVRKKQTVPQMHANLNFYFFSGCHLRGAPPRGGGLRPQPRPRPPRRPRRRRRRRFRLLDAHHAAGQEREGDLRGGHEVKGQTVSFLTLFFNISATIFCSSGGK